MSIKFNTQFTVRPYLIHGQQLDVPLEPKASTASASGDAEDWKGLAAPHDANPEEAGKQRLKMGYDLYNTDLYIFITHITSKFQFDRDMMSSQSTGRQILGTLRYPILRQTHMTNRNFFGPKGLLSEFQFAIYFAYISQCLHNLQAIYPVNLGDLHHGNGHNRMMMSSWKSTITRSS